MKSGLSVIITLIVSLVLAFCSPYLYKENTWFSAEKLEECSVESLPKISGLNYLCVTDKNVCFTMDETQYEDYVETVYEYLEEQDFAYLGTRGEEKSTVVGAFTTWYFEPVESMEECKEGEDGDYIFVYSDGEKNEDEEVVFNIITFEREAGTAYYGKKKFKYNTTMELRHESEDLLGGKYVLDEEETQEESALESVE